MLLVDDTIRTRWTVTVAGALLADAGATAVLPLAIHQLPWPVGVRAAAGERGHPGHAVARGGARVLQAPQQLVDRGPFGEAVGSGADAR